MLWKDLFPPRLSAEEQTRRGARINPPGQKRPPPPGTQVIIGDKLYEYWSSTPGIMPRLVGKAPKPGAQTQRCPTCGQSIQQAQQSNASGSLRKFL